jgi:hypothetical protein
MTGLEPFDHRRYVPVLLTRQGERLAMRELAPDIKVATTPLFAVHPIEVDPDSRQPKRSVQDHLDKVARQLGQDWGSGPAFVDLRHIDTRAPLSDGSHPVFGFVTRCAAQGLPLAPVISGAHDTEYRAAAVAASRAAETSIGIRLGPNEWPNLGTPLGDGHLMGLLGETGRVPEDVHLLIDLEDQVSMSVAMTAAAVRPALRALPQTNAWASLTVVGTGMPTGTQQVGRDGDAELPRLEWELWRVLSESDYRRPTFGDYSVQHPDPQSNFDPRFMDSSAQLRYTIASSWYVVRGRGVKRNGNEQIHDLAAQVVAHDEYTGPDFSWGDGWLRDCAERRCRPGNQGLWRKVTTNHHLTYVVRQLASLLGP